MSNKIGKEGPIYLDPHEDSDKDQFAQCSTCRMFVPEEFMEGKVKHDACVIHGSKVTVGPDYSCTLYVIWPDGSANTDVQKDHGKELAAGLKGSVTPKESGLVDREVRCENCRYFDTEGYCELFKKLNTEFPDIFKIDEHVDAYGCCNFNTAKPKEEEPIGEWMNVRSKTKRTRW